VYAEADRSHDAVVADGDRHPDGYTPAPSRARDADPADADTASPGPRRTGSTDPA
jgi:hypothetical protein